MTLEEFKRFIPSFLEYLQHTKNISLHTQRAYKADLEKLSLFWEKQTTQKDSYHFHHILPRFIQIISHKKTPQTIARKCSCFNSFTKYIEKVHQIHMGDKLTRPLILDKSPRLLTTAEIHYLLEKTPPDALDSHKPYRDKAIFQLLYATGILTSEIIQLRCEHINVVERTINITAHKQRILHFSDKTAQKLQEYLQYNRKPITHPEEYFFLNHSQEPLTTRSIQRICRRFSRLLSRKITITPFLLRYSYAQHLVMEGKSAPQLQELLGHRCALSTQRYYKVLTKNKL